VIELIGEAHAAGAGLVSACGEIGICLRTLKRWRKACLGDGEGRDRRKGSHRRASHQLTEEERQRILLTCNQPEYASLPPGPIVPALADRGLYIGSESSFYRVLHAHGQANRRGRAQSPQKPRAVPRLRAAGANQVWSWACLRERISKSRKQPLILNADNGNAMRAATLKSRLEELGALRSFSQPRVSNGNPFSESLFRTVKYRPGYARKTFASKDQACQWVGSFVDWYNQRHRHCGIKFVTPHARHSGQAVGICRYRTGIYERARQLNPRRWSGSIRCWHQPGVVWINKPLDELDEPQRYR
jgi:putative transposase